MMKISYENYRRRPFWLVPLLLGVAVVFMSYYLPDAGVLRIVVSSALLAMLVVGVNVRSGTAVSSPSDNRWWWRTRCLHDRLPRHQRRRPRAHARRLGARDRHPGSTSSPSPPCGSVPGRSAW